MKTELSSSTQLLTQRLEQRQMVPLNSLEHLSGSGVVIEVGGEVSITSRPGEGMQAVVTVNVTGETITRNTDERAGE